MADGNRVDWHAAYTDSQSELRKTNNELFEERERFHWQEWWFGFLVSPFIIGAFVLAVKYASGVQLTLN